MTQYTTPDSIPLTDVTDLIASSAENLRTRMNAVSNATQQGLTSARDAVTTINQTAVFDGDERLPSVDAAAVYAHAWTDEIGRVALGVKLDGSVEIGGNPVVPDAGNVPRRTAHTLTLSSGTGSEDTRTAVQVRLPSRLGVDARIKAINFRNYNDRSGLAYAGALSFSGVYFGAHAQDGSGKLTGNFTAAPTQIAGAATTPADGTAYRIAGLDIPMAANVDYLLSYGYTCAAQNNHNAVGGCWTNTIPGDVSAATAVQTVSLFAPLDVWFEVEIAGDVPIIAYIGDSLSAGVRNELPVYQSPPVVHSRANGYFPLMYVHSGSLMTSWINNTAVKYTKWETLDKADALVHALGKNDLLNATDTATLRARFADLYPIITARTSKNLYLTTIIPSVVDTDAAGAVRREWNEILRAELIGNANMLFDFSAALTLAGGTGLDPLYDGGDGTHLNKRGSMVLARAITQPIVGR